MGEAQLRARRGLARGRHRWAGIAISLPLILGGGILGAIAPTNPAPSFAVGAQLTSWSFDPATQELRVQVPGGTLPNYFILAQPPRIVLDLPNTLVGDVPEVQTYPGAVRQIRVGQFQPSLTRIVIELDPDVVFAAEQVQLRPAASGSQGEQWVLRPVLVGAAPPASPTVSPSPPPPPAAAPPPQEDAIATADVTADDPADGPTSEPPVEVDSQQPTEPPSGSENGADAAEAAGLPPLAPGALEIPVNVPPALPTAEPTDTDAVAADEVDASNADASDANGDEADGINPDSLDGNNSDPGSDPGEVAPSAPVVAAADGSGAASDEGETDEGETDQLAPDVDDLAAAPPNPPTPEVAASEPDDVGDRPPTPPVTPPPAAPPPADVPVAAPETAPAAPPSPPAPPPEIDIDAETLSFLPPATLPDERPVTVEVPSLETAIAASVASTSQLAVQVPVIEFGQPLIGLAPPPASVPNADIVVASRRRTLIPEGTVLSLRYPRSEALRLSAGNSRQDVLVLTRTVRDRDGEIIAPAGTQVIGRFEATAAGLRFVSQALSLAERNVPMEGQSVEQIAIVQPNQQIDLRLTESVRSP